MPEPPLTTYAADGCVIARWKNIAISVWAKPGLLADIQAYEALLADLSRSYARFSIVSLAICPPILPNAEVRERIRQLALRYQHQLACKAILLEPGGLLAQMVLRFVMSLPLLSEHSARQRHFFEIGELMSWLVKTHEASAGEAIDEEELQQVLASLLVQVSAPR